VSTYQANKLLAVRATGNGLSTRGLCMPHSPRWHGSGGRTAIRISSVRGDRSVIF
jgi:hypothetical protein